MVQYTLEGMLRERQKTIVRPASVDEAIEKTKQGKRFIPVDDSFGTGNLPDGYLLTHTMYQGKKFSVLMPRQAFWYMANAGEGGDLDSALDEVADLYSDIKDVEKEFFINGDTIVQEVDWATLSRENYTTYLINKLTKNGKDFDKNTMEEICANDSYVDDRCRAIASLVLDKKANEITKSSLVDLLVHKTSIEWQEPGTEEERLRCDCGSHYEYRTVVKRVMKTKTETSESISGEVSRFESEIENYVENKKGQGRHDPALIRQYINLAYIAKENPAAQLEITPPAKSETEKGEN